jgi:hypothetical protein
VLFDYLDEIRMPRRKHRSHFPTSKTFGKKRYHLAGVASNKAKARRIATQQKKSGNFARISRSGITKGKQKAPIKKGPRFVQVVPGRAGGKKGRWAVYKRSK